MRPSSFVTVIGTVVVSVSVAWAQDGRSAANAATLIRLMEARTLTHFAAKAAGDDDRYVSVLHVPNAQLLVVSSRYPVPAALDAKIAAKDFAGAYADHNGSTLREGKLFVMDLGADGLSLQAQRDKPFDIAYEDGQTTTMFDGDWRGQKLGETEYRKRFASIDQRYADMLGTLIEGVKALAP